MICGHGSRSEKAGEEFGLLAKGLIARYPTTPVEYGFLEYSAPNIHMGLERLVKQGVNTIIAVPGMLFAATHVKNDIPSVLMSFQAKHPDITVHYGRELGLHSLMIKAFEGRILEALNLSQPLASDALYNTMLVVVGRGTSDTMANAEAAKLARIVAENLGFGWTEIVYSGVTFPSVGRGLEMALKLGYKRIVVAPYFLFTGRLIDRINDYIDVIDQQNPDVTFIKAHYLSDQPHVIDTFAARIDECIHNKTPDSGLMQSFKQRLANGEVSIHHHHAEYQPESTDSHDHEHGHSHEQIHDHEHSHSHEHTHDHDHHHGYYQHAAHPHGPRTMIDDNICSCFMRQLPPEVIADERQQRAKRGDKPLKSQPPH